MREELASLQIVAGDLDGSRLRVCIVAARFNELFTDQLLDGAADSLLRHNVAQSSITVVRVPGSHEIPMAVDGALDSGSYDVAIALGVVIQGATPHADLINSQVELSLSALSRKHGIPVINGVVAARSIEQAIERCGSKAGNRGRSAAEAAVEMANLYRALQERDHANAT